MYDPLPIRESLFHHYVCVRNINLFLFSIDIRTLAAVQTTRWAQMALGLRKLCPAKRAWSPSSSSILAGRRGVERRWGNRWTEKEKRHKSDKTAGSISKSLQAVNTHLMSWLYLASRSDRQGAPVFIWSHTKLQGQNTPFSCCTFMCVY